MVIRLLMDLECHGILAHCCQPKGLGLRQNRHPLPDSLQLLGTSGGTLRDPWVIVPFGLESPSLYDPCVDNYHVFSHYMYNEFFRYLPFPAHVGAQRKEVHAVDESFRKLGIVNRQAEPKEAETCLLPVTAQRQQRKSHQVLETVNAF